MFLSREIDIKLCQIYMKIQIYAILYKSCSIKQIIFIPQKLNQSELKTLEWWISRSMIDHLFILKSRLI